MHSSPFRRGFAVVVLFLTSLSLAVAADVTARIKGTITDPSGAVLANVSVKATNSESGVAYTTVSQKSGDYQFLNLPVGTYSISAASAGFKAFSATGIALTIDQQYVEPIILSLGSSSETVEIVADSVQVDTTSMQLSTVVDASQIVAYPNLARSFTSLELITPGVQASSDRFAGAYSVNGAQPQQSSYLINGADTNDFALNTIGIQPNIDALSEFNLVTGSLNAEYSRNSGAIVSTVVKSGSNKFHGDAFEFYRDTFLNVKSYFAAQPVYHQNQFGGTIGGPIFKDKLFFFAGYQGTRARTPQTAQNLTLLSTTQLAGNFSASTFTLANTKTNPDGTLVDPVTGRIPGTIKIQGCTAGEAYTDCFKNGQVPTASFNPISVALNAKYAPATLINGPSNAYQYTPITTRTQDQGIVHVDFNPTAKDGIYFVGIYQHFPTADQIPFTGATVLGFGDQNTSEIRQVTGSYSRQISPTTLNEFLVHYTRFNFGSVTPQSTQLPSASGFAINPQDLAAASLPTIAVTNYFTLGFSTNGPQPRVDQNIQLDDNFSKIIGHHTLKFGYDGRRFTVDNEFNNSNSGSFGFNTGGTLSTGDEGLDFLLGIPASYGQGAGGRIDARAYENYFYGQDTWKATNSLTVNLGLGYQIDTAIHNLQFGGEGVNCFVPGQQSKIFPTAPLSLNFPGDPGCNNAQGATVPRKDFGPRIGFAYAPDLGMLSGGNSKKLSIRAGYGIYYNRTEEEGSLQNLGDAPFGVNSAGVTDYNGTALPQFANPYADIQTGQAFGNKFPATFPKPGDKTVDFEQFGALYISGYSPGYRAPYSENFNLTVERELPQRIVATASYVGTLGRHNQITTEGNPITQAGHDACLADSTCSLTGARNFQASSYPTHTLYPQAIDPNTNATHFHSVSLISTEGSSNYNALQLSLRKDPTHGLAGQISYTLSHSLDDTSSYEGSGFGGERGYNQFSKTLNYGNSGFDARHRLVIAPIYVVPYSSAGSVFSLRNLTTAGWSISGIATLSTGFPFDISYQGGTSRSLYCADGDFYYTCPDVPNLIGTFKRTDPRALTTNLASGNSFHAFFDGNIVSAKAPNASFGPEALGSFGNISRNKYHGPGLINADAEVAKQVRFSNGDTVKYIELRLEGYNVFNHTNFHNPSGNYLSNLGKISTSEPGRQVQLGAKIYF